MQKNIFSPLRMKDAGFYVPEDKRGRFATLYKTGPEGVIVPDTTGRLAESMERKTIIALLANQGELNGARIPAPSTVHLMTTNHVPSSLLTGEFYIEMQILRPGFGYGYNCAVVYDPPEANLIEGKGTFFWDGAAGTWF